MKLATFAAERAESAGAGAPAPPRARERIGAVVDADRAVVDLQAAHELLHGEPSPHLASMLALLDGGDAALAIARGLAEAAPPASVREIDDVRLLAPLPRPRQIRDFLCFEEHLQNVVEQMRRRGAAGALGIAPVWYEQPVYYTANALAVAGPDAEVTWPAYSESMDYELELALVIGRAGRDIAREQALSHAVGLTILNDLSARDAQMQVMPAGLGPGIGKDFDGGNVLGPWITTLDEIGDPQALAMEVRVNGERWGGGSSASMHHDFAAMIAHVSRGSTLFPGEVLASGTVGTGCAFEIGRELSDGDLIELEVERIGVLRTRVRRAPAGSRDGIT